MTQRIPLILSASEVQNLFEQLGLPFRFNASEVAAFQTTDIVVPEGRFMAFPTPASNSGLNILNLRDLLGTDPTRPPGFFDHPWYLDEAFGSVDCPQGWHCLQMEPDPATIERPLDYVRRRPLAVEVVLMLFLHFKASGEHLLLKKHTWCNDEASLGRIVTVGAFGRNGVFISGHPSSFASRGLGICNAITTGDAAL